MKINSFLLFFALLLSLLAPETGRAAESGERGTEGSGMETSIKADEYQALWKQSEHDHTQVLLTETVQVQSRQTTPLTINTDLRPVCPPSGMPPPHWGGA